MKTNSAYSDFNTPNQINKYALLQSITDPTNNITCKTVLII